MKLTKTKIFTGRNVEIFRSPIKKSFSISTSSKLYNFQTNLILVITQVFVHTETRNELEQVTASWNELEPTRAISKEIKLAKTSTKKSGDS